MRHAVWILAAIPVRQCPEPEPEPASIDTFAPRSAGRINLMWVTDVAPGATVAVSTAGATGQVELPGCPGLMADAGSGAVAGDDGTAMLEVPVDAGLQGLQAEYRVVESAGCTGSEPLVVTFRTPLALTTLDARASLVRDDPWDSFGSRLAAAGDTDGDGYDDLLVGSFNQDFPEVGGSLFRGPLSGVRLASSADATFEVESGLATNFGATLALGAAGDTNGDGFDDVVVGSAFSEDGLGAVYVLHGPLAGEVELANAAMKWTTGNVGAFGYSPSTPAGDANGDGADDFWIADASVGEYYLLSGAAAGISSVSFALAALQGGELYGGELVSGDLNGDGVSDAAFVTPGADFRGEVRVLHGPFSGPRNALTTADAVLSGEPGPSLSLFLDKPWSLAAVGDQDRDGHPDVLAGIEWNEWSSGPLLGSAFLFDGDVSGASLLDDLYTRIDGTTQHLAVGTTVASLGDLDADGFTDVAVSSAGDLGDGHVGVFFGPIRGPLILEQADVAIVGGVDESADHVISAGDLDADGVPDLAIAAFWGLAGHGAVYVFGGDQLVP